MGRAEQVLDPAQAVGEFSDISFGGVLAGCLHVGQELAAGFEASMIIVLVVMFLRRH